MLDILKVRNNTWEPPILDNGDIEDILDHALPCDLEIDYDYLIINKVEPYIDSVYVHVKNNQEEPYIKRFVFNNDYIWSYEDERIFTDRVLNNKWIKHSLVIKDIYNYYSKTYPEWNLKRYYTTPLRMLDHIYHCMRKDSIKEMLYKANLDELAANSDDLDKVDILSSKPTDIYDGISMRVLRSLNCKEGAILLASRERRLYIKELQMRFPGIFDEKLNDAHCKYIRYLIDGKLTVGETGRLFNARRLDLIMVWSPSQFDMFMHKEKNNKNVLADAEIISNIDPIYGEYIKKLNLKSSSDINKDLNTLRYYLLTYRDEYDARFKRSNRKRDFDLQERDRGYIVRFPQTINDFCREAIYMSNCLLAYLIGYLENDTTILFMRKDDSINEPFITIEIFNNELKQAYHRFNEDCTNEEAEWILKYCDRHGISRGKFKFNSDLDDLL